MDGAARIFLAGTARSGTTFLAKLLDSNRSIGYLHEPDSVDISERIPFLPSRTAYDSLADDSIRYLERLYKSRSTKSLGTRPFFDKAYRNGLVSALQVASVYGAKASERIGLNIPAIRAFPAPKARMLIKSVNSLARLPLFEASTDDVQFIQIVRNPCAVALSKQKGADLGVMKPQVFFETMFSSEEVHKYPFSREDVEQMSTAEQTAYQWMVLNGKTFDELNGSDRYLLASYEQTCFEPKEELLRICKFCSLEFDEQMEAYVRSLQAASKDQAEYFNVVRNPAASARKWKNYLSEREVDRIKAVVLHSDIGKLVFEVEDQLDSDGHA